MNSGDWVTLKQTEINRKRDLHSLLPTIPVRNWQRDCKPKKTPIKDDNPIKKVVSDKVKRAATVNYDRNIIKIGDGRVFGQIILPPSKHQENDSPLHIVSNTTQEHPNLSQSHYQYPAVINPYGFDNKHPKYSWRKLQNDKVLWEKKFMVPRIHQDFLGLHENESTMNFGAKKQVLCNWIPIDRYSYPNRVLPSKPMRFVVPKVKYTKDCLDFVMELVDLKKQQQFYGSKIQATLNDYEIAQRRERTKFANTNDQAFRNIHAKILYRLQAKSN